MKSVFRIYAKTTKTMDSYLYNELLGMGLKPKYEQLFHSFYFNANFHDLFNLSFNSLTVQNLYIQIGHKFPMNSQYLKSGRTSEEQLEQYLKKINFKGYFRIQRGIIQNLTMNLLIRQSTMNLPSQAAILGILRNHLHKQIIMKEYRNMVESSGSSSDKLQNYYDIKMLVHNKWQYEDHIKKMKSSNFSIEQQKRLIQQNGVQLTQNPYLVDQRQKNLEKQEDLLPSIPYQPHLIFYIRKNFGRFLLKINRQNLYKHGWKKQVGWAPMRETLTASTLYRAGFINRLKQEKKQLKLWDPFCGSGTIPLVACAMYSSLAVHKDYKNNFCWPYWPIYRQEYLTQYLQKKREQQKDSTCRILGSDIDIQSVKYSVQNFKKFLDSNPIKTSQKSENSNKFLNLKPVDQIFQLAGNSIYVGCGDFEKLAPTILNNSSEKVTIFSNLPYLHARSKQHHPINQLNSIYRRFNQMIEEYQQFIQNVFVIVDEQGSSNPNHFIKFGNSKWRIISTFKNGGIPVMLLGWHKNKDGWGKFEVDYSPEQNKKISMINQQKSQILQQYREGIRKIQHKQFALPKYIADPSKYSRFKRVLERRKARHLRAAYQIFAKKRQGRILFSKYARKQLALRLSKRGAVWKKKNMGIIGNKIQAYQDELKKQFEMRIQEGLKRSENIKEIKRNKQGKVSKKKW